MSSHEASGRKVVLLDEASSRLDPATERMLEEALDHLLKECTGIIIAHRIDTLKRADSILVLKEGQIVEYGQREELLRNRTSQFAQLYDANLQGVLP